MHNQPNLKKTVRRLKGSKNVAALLKTKVTYLIKSGMTLSEFKGCTVSETVSNTEQSSSRLLYLIGRAN